MEKPKSLSRDVSKIDHFMNSQVCHLNATNRIDGSCYRGEHDPTKSDKALDFDWAELQENPVKGYIESQEKSLDIDYSPEI